MRRDGETLKTADDLVAAGFVTPEQRDEIDRVARRYAVAISSTVARLIGSGGASDPIARQFIPDPRELEVDPRELADPIGDEAHSPVTGLVHRYPDRVLLKVVGVCPVYCRFCFRREMVGPDQGRNLAPDEVARALAYVAARPEIREVIMTGGDPLILSPRRVRALTAAIESIPHIEIIRWHSRVPVAAPDLVTTELSEALAIGRRTAVVAIHANHARELGPEAQQAIARLRSAGVTLLSQSVLLKGVNDDAAALEALVRAFLAAGVRPYYLHHADLAPGTRHLRTTVARGLALMRELQERAPDLQLPRYMLDIPGGFGKVPLEDDAIRRDVSEERYVLTDRNRVEHHYHG